VAEPTTTISDGDGHGNGNGNGHVPTTEPPALG
jgi:hypothetical protein